MNKTSKFKIIMNVMSVIFTLLTIIFFVLYDFDKSNEVLEILGITFLTIAFHFDIRIIIGNIIPKFKNHIDANKKYYRLRNFEGKLYNRIKVKKWKVAVPTYNLDDFNIEKNSIDKIITNMCNSEIVHTINVFASYVPLLFILWFGKPIAFIITSVLASIYDLQFVIIQRYNRARLIKIIGNGEK